MVLSVSEGLKEIEFGIQCMSRKRTFKFDSGRGDSDGTRGGRESVKKLGGSQPPTPGWRKWCRGMHQGQAKRSDKEVGNPGNKNGDTTVGIFGESNPSWIKCWRK